MRYYKCFQPGEFTRRGGFLLGLVGGYTTGRGRGMSLGLSCCGKACLFFKRTVEMWARKESVILSDDTCAGRASVLLAL